MPDTNWILNLVDRLGRQFLGRATKGTRPIAIEVVISKLDGVSLGETGLEQLADFLSDSGVDPESILEMMAQAGSLITQRDTDPLYLWNNEIFDELANLSKGLATRFPNTRFIGLGHSPSYVIYGINSFSLHANLNIETGYVPFSSGYLQTRTLRDPQAWGYSIDRDSLLYAAALKNRDAYRKFLESIGMYPQKILSDYEASKRRTALVDNIQRGTTFASFLHFMHVWAKDVGISHRAFSKAVQCIAFSEDPIPRSLRIPSADFSFEITPIRVSTELRGVLNGNLSQDNDRFVPYYYPVEWDRAPVEIGERTHPLVAQIKNYIDDAVQGKLAPDAALTPPDDSEPSIRRDNDARIEEVVKDFREGRRPPNNPPPVIEVQAQLADASNIAEAPLTVIHPAPEQLVAPQAPAGEIANVSITPAAEESKPNLLEDFRVAAVTLLKAYRSMPDHLSGSHQRLLMNVEGINPQNRFTPIEIAARNSRRRIEDVTRMLTQAKTYLVDETSSHGRVKLTQESVVAALRDYEQARPIDVSITNKWLETEDDEKTARIIQMSANDVKAARERVINKMALSLQKLSK